MARRQGPQLPGVGRGGRPGGAVLCERGRRPHRARVGHRARAAAAHPRRRACMRASWPALMRRQGCHVRAVGCCGEPVLHFPSAVHPERLVHQSLYLSEAWRMLMLLTSSLICASLGRSGCGRAAHPSIAVAVRWRSGGRLQTAWSHACYPTLILWLCRWRFGRRLRTT